MKELLPDQQTTVDAVVQAIEKSAVYLFARQRSDGSWADTLSSSAISTSVILVALYLTDQEQYAAYLEAGIHWLRKTQQSDGGWGDAVIDPSTLNSTAITTACLQLIDPERSKGALERGFAFIQAHGGWETLRDRSRCTLSDLCLLLMTIAQVYDWEKLPHIPVELFLLPFLRREVSFTMPIVFAWGILHTRFHKAGPLRRLLQRMAEPQILDWLRQVITPDGGCEESPLLVAVVYIALKLAGTGHDLCARILPYILSTWREDGSWPVNRDLELCATTYLILGFDATGYKDDPRLKSSLTWLLERQLSEPFPATGCPAGGWGWSLPSGWPNADDTARTLLVLTRLGLPAPDPHIRKGLNWLLKMQNKQGAWACFVRNGLITMDHGCPGITAYAMLALYECGGYKVSDQLIMRIRRYFENVQKPDGSIHSIWFRDHVAGTAFVLDAYGMLGLYDDPVSKRCQAWLLNNQNDDGCWGSTLGEQGTVEETSWALAALLASGILPADERLRRAALWLVNAQQEDGSWTPTPVDIYFSSMAYSSDHITNGYALQALGRYHQAVEGSKLPVVFKKG